MDSGKRSYLPATWPNTDKEFIMQAIIVTKDTLFSEAVTCAMLREMASKLFSMSDEAIEKSASEPLTKGTKHMKELTCAKLRTILATKLANSSNDEYGQLWRENNPTNGGDAGMWEIWQHIWNCTSFEDYFAKCPAKGIKSGGKGSAISASSEMNYAVRSGFIVLGPKPEAK